MYICLSWEKSKWTVRFVVVLVSGKVILLHSGIRPNGCLMYRLGKGRKMIDRHCLHVHNASASIQYSIVGSIEVPDLMNP